MHFDNQYDQYINKINIQIHRRIEELCHTANTAKIFCFVFFQPSGRLFLLTLSKWFCI